ncbi:hypothetical protein [Bacillus sp. KH172YL63]|uniref:hypothetical protein n=1 Tax=Bacillus sp. KH172YL63 TaxID=2709784 RepID=UPI0013E51593|nr:hypothetical protein [Bacillus sp. KH172YL63]BCB05160.1 hypothetical protein KH172YL63_32930 [Bacillus sp. KH172YL63]
MKKWIVSAAVMVALLSSMYMTKPTEDMYAEWLLEVMSERMGVNQPLENRMLKGLGKKMIKSHSEYRDYVFFSVHRTEFMGRDMRFVGVLGVFVPVLER